MLLGALAGRRLFKGFEKVFKGLFEARPPLLRTEPSKPFDGKAGNYNYRYPAAFRKRIISITVTRRPPEGN